MRALLVLLVVYTAAYAQPEPFDVRSPDAAEQAKQLFDAGRALLAEGKHAAACAKFRASWKLDQAPGTGLNLAECEERAGAYREAWGLFDAAARAAERKESSTRASFARERANALVPKLARVQVRIAESTTDIEVHVDGRRLETAAVMTDYVRPGDAFLVVATRGRWSHRLEQVAPAAGETLVIDVPPMDHGELVALPPPPEPLGPLLGVEKHTTFGVVSAIACFTLSLTATGNAIFGDSYRRESAAVAGVGALAGIGFVVFSKEVVYVRVKASSSDASASVQVSF